jgi:DNA-binding MarR family transcriptional regulator
VTASPDVNEIAAELRSVVSLLVRRFRADGPLPTAQMGALARLVRQGPTTTSGLAALERVRPQSMAHTVAELVAAELVVRRPDPEDRRQTILEPTDAGCTIIDDYRRVGESWVAEAVTTQLHAGERAELARAIELLRRLVQA